MDSQPYWQYTQVPANARIGVAKTTSTDGFAILVNHTFDHGFSLPVRYEYIASSGTAKDGSVNLMYGPGSAGTSFTATPTFQYGGFFFRGDLSFTHLGGIAQGRGSGQPARSETSPAQWLKSDSSSATT